MSEDKRKSTDYAAMERPIFEAWKDAGYFQRTPGFGEHGGESYTIVIPPPNITGVLHMGHALERHHPGRAASACARMRGVSDALGAWAPTMPASPPRPRWTSSLAERGHLASARSAARSLRRGVLGVDATSTAATIVEPDQGHGLLAATSPTRTSRWSRPTRAAVRKVFCDWYHDGHDLPRQAHRELVPALHHGDRRRRGRVRGGGRGTCGTCATRSYRAGRAAWSAWWWRPRAPRRCSATPAWPCSPKDERLRSSLVGATVKLPHRGPRDPDLQPTGYVDAGLRHGLREGDAGSHDPNDCGDGGARTGSSSVNIFDETAHVVEGYGDVLGHGAARSAREAVVAAVRGARDCSTTWRTIDHSVMHLLPLRHDAGAVGVRAVVRGGGGAEGAGAPACRGGAARCQFHPARWTQAYLDLAGRT